VDVRAALGGRFDEAIVECAVTSARTAAERASDADPRSWSPINAAISRNCAPQTRRIRSSSRRAMAGIAFTPTPISKSNDYFTAASDDFEDLASADRRHRRLAARRSSRREGIRHVRVWAWRHGGGSRGRGSVRRRISNLGASPANTPPTAGTSPVPPVEFQPSMPRFKRLMTCNPPRAATFATRFDPRP
jgi:hypothetical protein